MCHFFIDQIMHAVKWHASKLWGGKYYTRALLSGRNHHNDVIMGTMASQISSLNIVYSTVYSGADQRNNQSSRHGPLRGEWPVNSPHKRPVTRKIFSFDDVIMCVGIHIKRIHRTANCNTCIEKVIICAADASFDHYGDNSELGYFFFDILVGAYWSWRIYSDITLAHTFDQNRIRNIIRGGGGATMYGYLFIHKLQLRYLSTHKYLSMKRDRTILCIYRLTIIINTVPSWVTE